MKRKILHQSLTNGSLEPSCTPPMERWMIWMMAPVSIAPMLLVGWKAALFCGLQALRWIGDSAGLLSAYRPIIVGLVAVVGAGAAVECLFVPGYRIGSRRSQIKASWWALGPALFVLCLANIIKSMSGVEHLSPAVFSGLLDFLNFATMITIVILAFFGAMTLGTIRAASN